MFILIWQWLKRFITDPTYAAARLRSLLAVVAGSGYTFADDLAGAIGDPAWARRIKILAILLGVIAAAKQAGEKNEDAHAIAKKLTDAGYEVKPPPASGFARLALILGLALGSVLGLVACEPAEVNRVFGIQPASAMASPTASVQFVALGAAPPITWAVTEANGGTISASGLYTGPGCSTTLSTVHVTASAGGITSAPAVVTLEEKPISVAVSPASVKMAPNGTQQFTATVTTDCAVYTTVVNPKTGQQTVTSAVRKGK